MRRNRGNTVLSLFSTIHGLRAIFSGPRKAQALRCGVKGLFQNFPLLGQKLFLICTRKSARQETGQRFGDKAPPSSFFPCLREWDRTARLRAARRQGRPGRRQPSAHGPAHSPWQKAPKGRPPWCLRPGPERRPYAGQGRGASILPPKPRCWRWKQRRCPSAHGSPPGPLCSRETAANHRPWRRWPR